MLTARQIMRQPVRTVPPTDSVAQAVREMQRHGISSLLVPPRFEGELYGIITNRRLHGKTLLR